ncbi:DUF3825 domain-containing protein [Phormidium sp. FACHB-1136]|uniref:DUF3825 domain-containing protein n=1 Tax=Phormidium sp. FACHB-1136 TaxID=2692848 RepID=UPI001686FA02|nr:DUF3825 domain-containing protein [Phormidium sp. FACHB-1136]MBD2425894.1 DUF3825 domain-containing protein [Phormidium sp. FACHB-1136]
MWPEELFDFAYFPNINELLQELAEEAEPEDWEYKNTSSHGGYELPILFNYIKYTYRKLAEESKLMLSEDGQYCCFNTGLVTEGQEPIYASFEVNRRDGLQRWYFKGWFRRGRWELNVFSELPDLAHYFDDPSSLVLDTRKDLRVNVEHIVAENKDRFPEPYSTMQPYGLQTFLKGAIDNARERVRRNYKTAIPQYYKGQIQLLLPLCLGNPAKADLALVVERHSTFYRASTCLTLDMAYNNARQLTRPDRDWLQP